MSTILMRAHLRARASQRDQILKTLRHVLGPTGVAPGCVSCRAYVDIEDENGILYVEEWATLEDLRARLCDESFRAVLSALDVSCESPGVRFDTISESKGLELVQEVWNERKNTR